MANAVRCSAARGVPAHFQPYVERKPTGPLTDSAMLPLRKRRRTATYFASRLPGSAAGAHHSHPRIYVHVGADREANAGTRKQTKREAGRFCAAT